MDEIEGDCMHSSAMVYLLLEELGGRHRSRLRLLEVLALDAELVEQLGRRLLRPRRQLCLHLLAQRRRVVELPQRALARAVLHPHAQLDHAAVAQRVAHREQVGRRRAGLGGGAHLVAEGDERADDGGDRRLVAVAASGAAADGEAKVVLREGGERVGGGGWVVEGEGSEKRR